MEICTCNSQGATNIMMSLLVVTSRATACAYRKNTQNAKQSELTFAHTTFTAHIPSTTNIIPRLPARYRATPPGHVRQRKGQ